MYMNINKLSGLPCEINEYSTMIGPGKHFLVLSQSVTLIVLLAKFVPVHL